MNHSITHDQNASVTFSVLVASTEYKAVIGVERMIRRFSR